MKAKGVYWGNMNLKIPRNKKAVGLFLIYIAIIMGDFVSSLSYCDELATVFFLGVLFVIAMRKKVRQDDFVMFFCLLCIAFLGLISSVLSNINVSLKAQLIDALWLFKNYAGYLGIKYCLNRKAEQDAFLDMAVIVAKLFVVLSFVGAIINLLFETGMTDGDKRYGLRAYSFICGNSGHYGLIVAICLALILAKENRKDYIWLYSIMGTICIIATTKFMPIIVVLVYWGLKFQKVYKKIKVRYMVVGGGILAFAGRFQIMHYIKDLNHPRMRLLIYGFKTAKMYFPFGSGYATYGSEMARRYYSQLYDFWGFNNYYGLSRANSSCLNDGYIAMIVGQFGFFALLLYAVIMYIIYKQTVQNTLYINKNVRNITAGMYVCMLITSVMSGTFKSAIGMAVFMTMAVMESRINKVE